MYRRRFLQNTSLFAVAVSSMGFIRFDGEHYVGDCQTTSDILGPFYVPDSPVTSNLRISGDSGKPIRLTGTVKHDDCTTPYKNAKVELWHCDAGGVYDNSMESFRYRATGYTNASGEYLFDTILPVPYDAGGGEIRPAHFHMMVTAEGYQPLITQIYFSGDKQIENDLTASSAGNRVLDVKEDSEGNAEVYFDFNMAPSLLVEPSSMKKLTGDYIDESDPENTIHLFSHDKQLWVKNEVFGLALRYVEKNTFSYDGLPEGYQLTLNFSLLPNGAVKLERKRIGPKGERINNYIKEA